MTYRAEIVSISNSMGCRQGGPHGGVGSKLFVARRVVIQQKLIVPSTNFFSSQFILVQFDTAHLSALVSWSGYACALRKIDSKIRIDILHFFGSSTSQYQAPM